MQPNASSAALPPSSQSALLLLGRCLAGAIFIVTGWGKLTAAAATKAYLAQAGLPLPDITYYGVVAIELGGGLALVTGLKTRVAALVLAAFCIASALIAHTDFTDRNQMLNFLKNVAMAGGYVALFVAGAGDYSADRLMMKPAANQAPQGAA